MQLAATGTVQGEPLELQLSRPAAAARLGAATSPSSWRSA